MNLEYTFQGQGQSGFPPAGGRRDNAGKKKDGVS